MDVVCHDIIKYHVKMMIVHESPS